VIVVVTVVIGFEVVVWFVIVAARRAEYEIVNQIVA